MKQKMLILGIAVLSVGLAAIFLLPRTVREGELSFTPESVDLGQVPLEQKAPAKFEMRNVGGKPVKILKGQVKTVEGC